MGNSTFAKNLVKLRESNSLTQQQVADAIDLKRSTYAYYENGKTEPKRRTLEKLAKIFNVSVDDLFMEMKHDSISYPLEYDNGWRTSEKIGQLTPFEQSILLRIRMMTPEEKTGLIRFLENDENKTSEK